MICKLLNQHDLPAASAIIAQYPELNWTQQMLQDSFVAAQNQCWGAFKEGRLLGLALFQVVEGEAELLLIVTDRHFLKQGCARRLLAFSMVYFDTVFLEVRASNEPAKRLYESLGFIAQGVRKNYYAHPAEDAVLYQRG
jgi:ribosomal-protein-alanine N-acetyltransferase